MRFRDLRVLGTVCSAADPKTGEANISQRRISERAHLTRRKVGESLKRLQDLGYLTPLSEGRGERGRYRSARYVVHYAVPHGGNTAVLDAVPHGGNTATVNVVPHGGNTDAAPHGGHITLCPTGGEQSDLSSPESREAREACAPEARTCLRAPDKGRGCDDGEDLWALRLQSLRKRGGFETVSDGSRIGDNAVFAVEMIREGYGDAEAARAVADTKGLSGARLMFALFRRNAELNCDPQADAKNGQPVGEVARPNPATRQPIQIDTPHAAGRLASREGEP